MLPRKKSVGAFSQQQDKLSHVVILAIEDIEYKAACAHLNTPHESIYQGMVYTYGIFSADKQQWHVSILEIGEERLATSLEVSRAITYFQPDIILLVCTAYGVQEVELGDVLCATKIYTYQTNMLETTFQAGPAIWHIHDNIEQQARAEAKRSSWRQRISDIRIRDSITPRIVFAPIASVVEEISPTNPQALFTQVHTYYKDVIAIEMSGYEILQAAQANQSVDTLVLCGIADILQEQDRNGEDRRNVAAQNASAFAFEMLAGREKPSPPPQKTEAAPSHELREPIEIFYSYVDKDEALVKKLQQQLVMLKRMGQISEWHMGKITAGEHWDEHRHHLETARLILLLVSPDYMASDHHYKEELERALQKRRAGDAKVILILLRPTNGLDSPIFNGLQIIPSNAEALTLTGNLDQAFKEVGQAIHDIVRQLRSNG